MPLSLIKKSLIIGTIIGMASCTSATVTKCHQFTYAEQDQIGDAIDALPPTSPVRWVDKDYERVCINLK